MEKQFRIIKMENLLNGEQTVCRFTYNDGEEDKKKKLLNRLYRNLSEADKQICKFHLGEILYMNLPSFSEQTIKEISKHIFSTAYVVCKKNKGSDEVLYLSLFKDTAIKFRNAIPAAKVKIKEKEYINPNYCVKEIKLLV